LQWLRSTCPGRPRICCKQWYTLIPGKGQQLRSWWVQQSWQLWRDSIYHFRIRYCTTCTEWM
jgi:hypothetical protein